MEFCDGYIRFLIPFYFSMFENFYNEKYCYYITKTVPYIYRQAYSTIFQYKLAHFIKASSKIHCIHLETHPLFTLQKRTALSGEPIKRISQTSGHLLPFKIILF